jgi:hypothetical protein
MTADTDSPVLKIKRVFIAPPARVQVESGA